ncbi:DUF3422 domain-containing protein [Methylomarinum sp. Ch1-1]|uniref:DUF3422 domain-containing protein n=1 Tax=Methylomarinum roseum TaxID=3067653 RepID=A0AAU7NXA8_9GAMM|nr:DUF3422 domain-containing protein [Methylomarinum sp. Ch1-1]MDP4522248.1 DUF3422 domain-containing protein [Methylomarinum sp. Ch1-1]
MTTLFPLPDNHPQRFKLHNEVHARSSVILDLPVSASHLTLMQSSDEKKQDRIHLIELCERFGVTPPKQDANHFSARYDNFQLRWEQHGEFTTYTFYVHKQQQSDPFKEPALKSVPVDWMAQLVGKVIVAAHAAIIPASETTDDIEAMAHFFAGNALIGAKVSGGAAQAYTDFRIHIDGFSRFLIVDDHLKNAQAGRLLQRLFEIEVYRVMALLAFPIARKLTPVLIKADHQLIAITAAMAEAGCDDGKLLDELTTLAAEVENHISCNHYRFGAASAYYNLVNQRIEDLREKRIQGLQTFSEFMGRRLEPAINTCQSTAKRFNLLSERISNAGELLRTRVDISIERQNQDLLKSVSTHAKMQVRLQGTVEGVSIFAITSYAVSLIGSIAQAMKSADWDVNPPLVIGISIPFVLTVVAIGVRRIHKLIQKIDED